jgi:hypothetical protein
MKIGAGMLEEPGLRKRPGPALLVWSLPVAETEEEVFVQFAGTV